MVRVEKGYGNKRLVAEFSREKNYYLASVERLMHKIDTTGSADRKTGSGRRRTLSPIYSDTTQFNCTSS